MDLSQFEEELKSSGIPFRHHDRETLAIDRPDGFHMYVRRHVSGVFDYSRAGNPTRTNMMDLRAPEWRTAEEVLAVAREFWAERRVVGGA
jgi:hypothetical protein